MRTGPDWSARLAALRRRWLADGQQACVVSSPINIGYLTGFSSSAGLLCQTRDRDILLLDGRYTTVAMALGRSGGMADVRVEAVTSTYQAALGEWVSGQSVTRVAFESDYVTVAGLARWQAATGVAATGWRGIDDLVERLRLTKDPFEIAVFRRAGAALAGVAGRLTEWVRAGRTELEVAADIDNGLIQAGFSHPAFDTIVASGPHSAHPHARPGDRRLSDGDLVVLDFGGVLDGYCVDLTRMAAVGRVSGEALGLVRAVRAAQDAALAKICAGISAGAVDEAARQVLDARGLGAAFVHGTGHGLGREVHEAPRLSRHVSPDDQLLAGMVCTVEPGAYVPGLGGARLEDDVLVTDIGADVLTAGPRDLLTV